MKSPNQKKPVAKLTSTSTPCGSQLGAAWIASAAPRVQKDFLKELTEDELRALPWMFEFWAMEHQLPPEGDWRTWVILGGRGAGKTRAGSEWIRQMVEGSRPKMPGRCARVALVGETLDQAREVMVFGESGILACAPPDRRPHWSATRRQLTWPNGAVAQIYSASDPESLRGPQFDCAWVDELAKWKKPQEAWDMLQFALRLGDNPQQLVTTTPRNVATLKEILSRDNTRSTHASTDANRANLAKSFLQDVRAKYAGTRLARQELDGVLLDQEEGALWSHAHFTRSAEVDLNSFDRIVVAVDPPVTHSKSSDECGIVAVGAHTQGPAQSWRATVLADLSFKPKSPNDWARRAIAAMQEFHADRLVAEVNQGGDMVKTIIATLDPLIPFTGVHAARGKAVRAEPVAALYEQGRVTHAAGLQALEDQMCRMTHQGYRGSGSPDRVDALVWAIFELMLAPAQPIFDPKIRSL
ncbi:terminase large subunit domain-containing protein [Planktomarina sp.]|uniref:DNA-packaging protein n=1 Tax=Planktomarina sp. TaxID=2024851 RepID=UPI003260FE88